MIYLEMFLTGLFLVLFLFLCALLVARYIPRHTHSRNANKRLAKGGYPGSCPQIPNPSPPEPRYHFFVVRKTAAYILDQEQMNRFNSMIEVDENEPKDVLEQLQKDKKSPLLTFGTLEEAIAYQKKNNLEIKEEGGFILAF